MLIGDLNTYQLRYYVKKLHEARDDEALFKFLVQTNGNEIVELLNNIEESHAKEEKN